MNGSGDVSGYADRAVLAYPREKKDGEVACRSRGDRIDGAVNGPDRLSTERSYDKDELQDMAKTFAGKRDIRLIVTARGIENAKTVQFQTLIKKILWDQKKTAFKPAPQGLPIPNLLDDVAKDMEGFMSKPITNDEYRQKPNRTSLKKLIKSGE